LSAQEYIEPVTSDATKIDSASDPVLYEIIMFSILSTSTSIGSMWNRIFNLLGYLEIFKNITNQSY